MLRARLVPALALLIALGCEGTIELSIAEDAGPRSGPRVDASFLGGGGDAGGVPPSGFDAGAPPSIPDAGTPGLTWKAILVSGDDSITAFDNARHTLSGMFAEGVDSANLLQLSRTRSEQVGGVRDTTADNIEQALTELAVGEGDACLVHMTSHGSREGFYIARANTLTPSRMAQILDHACGDRPTVVLISACYSGVFLDDLAAPNRVILTAAREDRTSFGCSAEAEYTYWDGCLIDELPAATTWSGLYASVTKCIEGKEGGFTPSYPQVSLGSEVMDLRIFGR
ncbi:MAG: C13 family peptidase [Sandaracinaceae bacterium]